MSANLDGGTFDDYSAGDSVDGGGFGPGPDYEPLERMRQFIAAYPHAEALQPLSIDYADRVPGGAGLFPGGLVEVRRTTDLLGSVTVESQYNFALYTVMTKAPGEDDGATLNAEWQMAFQEWVQEQSARHLAPTFGDEPRTERMTAQNGTIFSADEEGVAVCVIQISASFKRFY